MRGGTDSAPLSDPWSRLPLVKELLTSAGAQARLQHAQDWLCRQGRALVVGASLEAASEVVRGAARRVPAAFGWQRMTPGRLAAVLASRELARRGVSPLSPLGVEAVCARVVHQLGGASALGRFQPVAQQPGLPRALSRSLQEARLAGVRPEGDLGRLLEAYEAELLRAHLADRAEVFRLALLAGDHPLLGLPALLVDLPLQAPLEERLLGLLRGEVLAVAPAADAAALSRALSVTPRQLAETARSSLSRVQQRLFNEGDEEAAPLGDDVQIFSAPGESRECVEIARRIRREAEAGVPFDRQAVLLRAPSQYRALLEEAFARAGIPAFFASGTRLPDPAGRAFLALLSCAAEGLSARAFGEYLSLGEVPDAPSGLPPRPPPPGDRWVPPDAELDARLPPEPEPQLDPVAPADVDAPVVAGALRAPWRWEQLLVDAAVIGGRHRWERRLSGLRGQLEKRRQDSAEDETRAQWLESQLLDLAALRNFALPLLDALAALPQAASWGDFLDPLTALATQALREPARVLSLLAELAPMAPVGPVTLAEVRLVLTRRLTELPVPPSGKRHGKVYVAEAAAARGLSFDVVFVPGLAEKLFPQKVMEDPLLRDRERLLLAGLETSEGRIARERLLLRLAVGAARERVVLSWPRIDLSQGRARVPSFYGLEVLRAAEGELPAFAALSRRAEQAGGARAGWPSPPNPADAIDEAEHDLALLMRAFHLPETEARGTAAYLLSANPHLKRALRMRARRWLRRWTPADGLVQPSPEALEALQAHLPVRRPYSPTALQNYASCPYKFVLQAVHRLSPREVPEAIDEIDPMERGALIHKVQYRLLQQLAGEGAFQLSHAQERLDAVVEEVAREWEERLAPAIDRVWQDCVAGVKVDLREWLRRLSEEKRWKPWRFELAFGLADGEERDPHSTKEPVAVEGLKLRGSIDLVERADDGALRATDYKTGRVWAKPGSTVIGGGGTLQPALYALVLEKIFPGARVEGGQLYYCTFAGEFTKVVVPLDTAARGSVAFLGETVAQAVKEGFLPAAPKDDKECGRCDYQPVCGPGEWLRVQKKPPQALAALVQLRKMP